MKSLQCDQACLSLVKEDIFPVKCNNFILYVVVERDQVMEKTLSLISIAWPPQSLKVSSFII